MAAQAKNDHYWRCDCGAGHFLSVTWWPDDDQDDTADVEGYLNVEGDFASTLWHRLRMSWDLLRTGHADSRVGLVLTPRTARQIARTLTEFAESKNTGASE